jgi:hypothetical protein
MEKPRNLSMPKALNLVQLKNGPITFGKCLQSTHKRNPIEGAPQPIIGSAVFTLCWRTGIVLTSFIQGDLTRTLSSKMHKSGGHRNAMQPTGQCGFSAKRAEFSEYLNENVLRKIIGFRRVVRHPKADCIYAVFMQLKQRGECIGVTVQGSAYKSDVRIVGCGGTSVGNHVCFSPRWLLATSRLSR